MDHVFPLQGIRKAWKEMVNATRFLVSPYFIVLASTFQLALASNVVVKYKNKIKIINFRPGDP